MEALLNGLITLVDILKKSMCMDIQYSHSNITLIIWDCKSGEVIEFESFSWKNRIQKLESIQKAIQWITDRFSQAIKTQMIQKGELVV